MQNALPDIPRLYTALAEWGACMIFLVLLPKRFRPFRTGLLCTLALVLQSLFLIITSGASEYLWVLYMIIAFALMFGFLFCCCKTGWRDVLYCALQALILAEFIASLEWQVYCFYFYADISTLKGLPLFLLFCIVFYFLYGLLLKRQKPGWEQLDIQTKEVLMVAFITVVIFSVSNLSFMALYLPIVTPFTSVYGEAVATIRTIVDLCGVAILFAYHVLRSETMALREVDTLQRMLQSQYQQYEQSQESIELINYKYHDLKHQIAYLRSEEDPQKRGEFLDHMEEDIRQYESQNKTGNKVLDTILTSKSMTCQKDGISLTCVADGTLLEFIDVMDLCSILGNALDNAIECERKVDDPEKRLIHVAIFSEKNFLIMRFENYFEGNLEMQNGSPATTKEEKEFHGYGLKSIQYTANKYHGAANISTRDNWFELKILIPLPNQG